MTSMAEPQRTPAAYRRDLQLARHVVAQLRDQALASGEPFQVGTLALDAAALDALWDSLDGGDSHFHEGEVLVGTLQNPDRQSSPSSPCRPRSRRRCRARSAR